MRSTSVSAEPIAVAAPEVYALSSDSTGLYVECAAPVIAGLCTEAVHGLHQMRHGGLEIGGVLFGVRSGNSVTILAARRFQCEHRFGPSFVLSDRDQRELSEFLVNYRSDNNLAAFEPLGCFFSHSRRGPELKQSDIDVWNRHFPDPSQVALLVLPGATSWKIRAFERDRHNPDLAQELSVTSPAEPRSFAPMASPIDRPAPTGSPLSAPLAAPEAAAEVASTPEPPRAYTPVRAIFDPYERREKRGFGDVAMWVFAIALVAAAVVLVNASGLTNFQSLNFDWSNFWQARNATAVQLTIAGTDDGLDLHWGPLQAVESATHGTLEVRDGDDSSTFSLDAEQLRTGNMNYERKGDRVDVRLTLYHHDSILGSPATAMFLAPDATPPAPSSGEEARIPPQPASTDGPSPAPKPEPIKLPAPKPEPAKPRPFSPPPRPAAAATQRPHVISPGDAPTLQSFNAPSVPVGSPNFRYPLPPPKPEPKPAPASRALVQPESGRVIWTGRLPGGTSLVITGGHASSGYLNASLPGFPITIQARPAELDGDRITIFANQSRAGSEAPNGQNGWKSVVYRWDPERASSLLIRERPDPSNNWTGMVVQNGGHTVSVVVLDWRRATN